MSRRTSAGGLTAAASDGAIGRPFGRRDATPVCARHARGAATIGACSTLACLPLAAALILSAGAAHAQSAITLYGGARAGNGFEQATTPPADADLQIQRRAVHRHRLAVRRRAAVPAAAVAPAHKAGTWRRRRRRARPPRCRCSISYVHLGGLNYFQGQLDKGPYVAGGLGITYLSPNLQGTSSRVRASMNVGIGYQFPLGKSLALRTEMRGYLTADRQPGFVLLLRRLRGADQGRRNDAVRRHGRPDASALTLHVPKGTSPPGRSEHGTLAHRGDSCVTAVLSPARQGVSTARAQGVAVQSFDNREHMETPCFASSIACGSPPHAVARWPMSACGGGDSNNPNKGGGPDPMGGPFGVGNLFGNPVVNLIPDQNAPSQNVAPSPPSQVATPPMQSPGAAAHDAAADHFGNGSNSNFAIRTLGNRADLVSDGDALIEVQVPEHLALAGEGQVERPRHHLLVHRRPGRSARCAAWSTGCAGRPQRAAPCRSSHGGGDGHGFGHDNDGDACRRSPTTRSAGRSCPGRRITPWICATANCPVGCQRQHPGAECAAASATAAVDAQCNIATEYEARIYHTTTAGCSTVPARPGSAGRAADPPANACFKPYTPGTTPPDLATTTTRRA